MPPNTMVLNKNIWSFPGCHDYKLRQFRITNPWGDGEEKHVFNVANKTLSTEFNTDNEPLKQAAKTQVTPS